MISVIIATYNESKTIGKAIESFLGEDVNDMEIIIVAPDKETIDAAKKYKKVKTIKEKFKSGKPAALNLALNEISKKSEILIYSDGDVFIKKGSLKHLLAPFKKSNVGAVSGNPISLNPLDNKYGFWSYVLTKVADNRRKKAIRFNKRIFFSGYLFAIRKNLIMQLPEELLSEDGYLSHKVYENGYKIDYSSKSKVYIKYPNNFKDWIKQKKRSAGGYNQNFDLLGVKIRSFSSESKGIFQFFNYVRTPLQFFWLLQLFLARLYLWAIIYKDINIKKKTREEIWLPVESTK